MCEDCFQVWGCLMRDFVGFIDSWEVVLAFSVAIIGDRSSRSRISAISLLISASFSASASLSRCCELLLMLPSRLVLVLDGSMVRIAHPGFCKAWLSYGTYN